MCVGEGGWVIENRYALRSCIFILSLHLYVVIFLVVTFVALSSHL